MQRALIVERFGEEYYHKPPFQWLPVDCAEIYQGNYLMYDLRRIRKNRDKRKGNTAHVFITISFPDTKGILGKHGKIGKKKWVSQNEYHYSIEQRGDTVETMGKGMHIHILIKDLRKRRSHIIRELASTFNIKKNFIDVRQSNKAGLYEIRKNYIMGVKTQDKMKKVAIDRIFRQKNNLRQYYTNGEASHEQ